MKSGFIKTLEDTTSFSVGMVKNTDTLYVKSVDKLGQINLITNKEITREWSKEDFSLSKAVVSLCIVNDDNTPYVDVGVVRILNVLVTDIVGANTGHYSQRFKYDSVEVTYRELLQAFPWSTDGLTLEEYADFLNTLLAKLFIMASSKKEQE